MFSFIIILNGQITLNCWHRFTDIKSFEKRLENSLDPSQNFCQICLQYLLKDMVPAQSVFYGDLVFKVRMVKS